MPSRYAATRGLGLGRRHTCRLQSTDACCASGHRWPHTGLPTTTDSLSPGSGAGSPEARRLQPAPPQGVGGGLPVALRLCWPPASLAFLGCGRVCLPHRLAFSRVRLSHPTFWKGTGLGVGPPHAAGMHPDRSREGPVSKHSHTPRLLGDAVHSSAVTAVLSWVVPPQAAWRSPGDTAAPVRASPAAGGWSPGRRSGEAPRHFLSPARPWLMVFGPPRAGATLDGGGLAGACAVLSGGPGRSEPREAVREERQSGVRLNWFI